MDELIKKLEELKIVLESKSIRKDIMVFYYIANSNEIRIHMLDLANVPNLQGLKTTDELPDYWKMEACVAPGIFAYAWMKKERHSA